MQPSSACAFLRCPLYGPVGCWNVKPAGGPGSSSHFALGDLFGGRAGFEKKLQDQGFVEVRNIPTEEEVKSIGANKKMAEWSGPWLPEYPWDRKAN